MTLRILHLEDSPDDCELVRVSLRRGGLPCDILTANSGEAFLAALERRFDVILSDSGIPGYDGREALCAARKAWPEVPFIVVSGHIDPSRTSDGFSEEADAHVPKSALHTLAAVISAAIETQTTIAAI